jgi:HEAT repeat protein
VPVLADVLGSETEDDVRAAAARALARIRSADARAALLEASRGGSSLLLAVVAESLGTAGEDAAGARLVELLGFPSSPVRAAAAEASHTNSQPVHASTATRTSPSKRRPTP